MRLKGPLLDDVCHGRDNNLNLIRMVASVAVLVSHAWQVTLGPEAVLPLMAMLGRNLGTMAVYAFFVISGFLIARSFERQPTVGRWIMARVLRLYPALLVVLVLTVTVLGPLVTGLPLAEYFSRSETLTYVPRNLSLAFMQYDLPGVFQDQPYPRTINGSLWTLFFEVACYAGVLVTGLLGGLRRPGLMIAFLAVFAAAYILILHVLEPGRLPSKILPPLMDLGLPFATGVAFHVWRRRIRLSPAVFLGLALVTALLAVTPAYAPMMVVTFCYGIFLLGYLPGGFVRRYNQLGDYSYGVYIYAYPMQQLMVHLFQPMAPLTNIALALPPTLALAILSWKLVEEPALKLTRRSAKPGLESGAVRGS